MGSLELAVSPVFLGKENVMLTVLVAFLFLLLSPTGCICILRGDHFFLVLVTAVPLDFLLFCFTHSLLDALTSFVGPLLWSSPRTAFGFPPVTSGGIGSGGTAKEKSVSELLQRD